MLTFILRRLVLSIPVLIGILAVTFYLGRSIPGDPCRSMLGEKVTKQACDAFILRYGLDRPLGEQFRIYVDNFVHGDLGVSLRFGRPVTTLLVERLPITIELAVSALLF